MWTVVPQAVVLVTNNAVLFHYATTPASLARRLKNLQPQAHALNLTLVPAP